MAWVKLHDDILGDPKLMRAARRGGTELVLLPWLLAFASKAADHGRLSVGATAAEPEDIAYQIPGVTAAQIEACLRTCVAIGVLEMAEDGCFRFAKWEDRQAKPSASKSAVRERVQRHRAKRRERNAPEALQGVSGHSGNGNGAVAAPALTPVTPRNATEKRRGEEKREDTDIDRVVSYYVSRHPKRRPGEKDRKLIARHLTTYTADELCEAIDGNADDEWAQKTGKHELGWVLRDNGQIDTYRDKAQKGVPKIVDGWFAEVGR
jgi:hypothetical protein